MVKTLLFVSLALSVAAVALAILPLPTPSQLQYQQHEIMALIHFNMATFVGDGDPACNPSNWNQGVNCSNPAVFNPAKLNISNWIESFKNVGVKHGVLTAKHGCGFLLFNTKSVLPDGSPYNFGVMRDGPSFGRDVAMEFAMAMKAAGLGHGYYYSTGNNFYLNRINFQPAGALLPGQGNVTDDQYNEMVIQHLTELWSQYGDLFEIWFDHGYSQSQKPLIQALLQKYQPNANGFGGYQILSSPVRWCGTESGFPTYPLWSTGCDSDSGDPNSTDFCPAGVDTTLQTGDHWFFLPGQSIRPLSDLINVYHSSVGQNGVLELDFAINRDGLVEPSHAQRYAEFGDWIRSCYGTPVAQTGGSSDTITLQVSKPVDRIIISEDLSKGQRVRQYVVEYQTAGSSTWTTWFTGSSIGNKRIQVDPKGPQTFASVRVRFTQYVDTPIILQFAVFLQCPSS